MNPYGLKTVVTANEELFRYRLAHREPSSPRDDVSNERLLEKMKVWQRKSPATASTLGKFGVYLEVLREPVWDAPHLQDGAVALVEGMLDQQVSVALLRMVIRHRMAVPNTFEQMLIRLSKPFLVKQLAFDLEQGELLCEMFDIELGGRRY